MSMPWSRAASLVYLVPRWIGIDVWYEGYNHEAAPGHFEFETNILNARPAGKWPRLTVTLLDARVVSETLATPGQPAPFDVLEVDVLVSVSNPDPVWTAQSNDASRQLLGFALGYLHQHPKKNWALAGPGGGPNIVFQVNTERKPYEQDLMNSTFEAAQVALMPAIAYTGRVVQVAPSGVKPSWPSKWKAQAKGMLVGADGMRAAEDFAAANNTQLVWADELVDDGTALAALAAEGWIVAVHDSVLLVDEKVDRKRAAALPPGALVIGRAENAKLFDRAGLPTLPPA
jgi:hypothetical protein